MKRLLSWAILLAAVSGVATAAEGELTSSKEADAGKVEISPPLPDPVWSAIENHCADCHDDLTMEGNLDLFAVDFLPADPTNREQWIRIFDRVEQGEMPPPEKKHDFTDEERAAFVAALGGSLTDADRAEVVEKGRGPLRRLTRDEFADQLRDLLEMPHLDVRDKLPAERESHGFTKVTKMLDVSRVQLEGWLDAAEAALTAAVATGVDPPPMQKFRATGTDLFPGLGTFGNREAMFFARDGRMVPISGQEYQKMSPEERRDPTLEAAIFRSATWPYFGYPRGFVAKRDGTYRVRFSARAVRQVADFRLLPAHEPQPMSFRARQPSGPDVSGDVRETGGWMDLLPEPKVFETTIRLKAGETFEYSLLGLPVPFIRTDGGFFYDFPPMPPEGHRGAAFQWVEVEGPLAPETWPPASHRVLFGDLPIEKAPEGSRFAVAVVSDQPKADAAKLFRRFARQAAREPVPEETIARYLGLIHDRLDAGRPFAEAMLKGYQAFLCSGPVVYLREPSPEDPHALASRLSYFLTNTAPDSRLQELAASGKLAEPDLLRAETDRLIEDERFDRFVAGFTDQWLDLSKLRRDIPDGRLYPEYRKDDYLVDSMERETRAFFRAMVRENLFATTLVDADFTYVNDRLARHYDLPRTSGSAMRKVTLPEGSPYGGLLTQASILKHTANGTTTSPVLRGVWVMEKILGDPPPPVPTEVPAIEPDIRGAATIRDQLAKHTEVKSCAACHTHFDPVGFALENFDVMGAWRDRYRGMEKGDKITGVDPAGHPYTYFVGHPVDASGELRNGKAFRDVHELKTHLAAEPRALARNLLGQLTLYATGVPVRFSDRPVVESLLDRCEAGGYRVRDLVHAFVGSELFRGVPQADPTGSHAGLNPVSSHPSNP